MGKVGDNAVNCVSKVYRSEGIGLEVGYDEEARDHNGRNYVRTAPGLRIGYVDSVLWKCW